MRVILRGGVLRRGQFFVCGLYRGVVKSIRNDLKQTVDVAHPGQAVEIMV